MPYRGYGDQKLLDEQYPIQQGRHFNEFTLDHFVNDRDNPYETAGPVAFQWRRGYQSGGRSLTWGRHCYRRGDLDFEANLKDGHGVDWPIRYKDIASWYDHVARPQDLRAQRLQSESRRRQPFHHRWRCDGFHRNRQSLADLHGTDGAGREPRGGADAHPRHLRVSPDLVGKVRPAHALSPHGARSSNGRPRSPASAFRGQPRRTDPAAADRRGRQIDAASHGASRGSQQHSAWIGFAPHAEPRLVRFA